MSEVAIALVIVMFYTGENAKQKENKNSPVPFDGKRG